MKKWLFIRGLVRNQFHWHHFPSVFRQHYGTCECYFLDIPGNGISHDHQSPENVQAIVSRLRTRLIQNDITPPYNLIAISLGGMAALQWCCEHEEEVAQAVVINTSASNLSHWYERFSLTKLPHVVRLFTQKNQYKEIEQLILSMTSQVHQYNYTLLSRWEEIQQRYPTSKANALRQLVAASRFKLLQKPETPILCINSHNDTLVSPSCTRRIAQFLGAELRTHNTAGHDIPLDDPEWLAASISEWSIAQDGSTEPSADTEKQLSADAEKQPSADTEKQLSADAEKQPSTDTEKQSTV